MLYCNYNFFTMRALKITFLIFSFVFTSCFANVEQQEEYKNDYLYSDAYFDYLIECASLEKQAQDEKEKELKKTNSENNQSDDEIIVSGDDNDELNQSEIKQDEIVISDSTPFKLRIENFSSPKKYGETFKKVDSKTIIPVNDKFSFIQNMTQVRNKYNSNDYKILAGAEFTPCRFFSLASGLEANYRDIDQIPTSRKLYITPSLFLGDKISLSFYNKIDTNTHSTDHDIGLNVSPFKSKFMDFGIYAGLTRNTSGSNSQSALFKTNFYFF